MAIHPPFVLNEDPERVNDFQAPMLTGVITAVSLVALLIVIMRTYIRLVLLRSPGVQDGLMILSATTALIGTIILFLQIPFGLGRHADTNPRPELATFGKFSFIHTVVSLLGGIACLKISIALELMKYNGKLWRWYNITLWCLIGFVILYTIEAWLSFILFCQPVAKQWDQSLDGSCYPVSMFIKFGLANTAFNIFTDVAFATLPIPIVWSLKIPVKTRVYLIVVLSLGYIAVAMGVTKAFFQINFDPMGDTTFGYDVQFWGLLQLSVGIIAACAPSLKPLVKNVLHLKSSTPRYGYNSSARRNASGALYTIGGGTAASRGYTKQSSRTDAREVFELSEGFHENHIRSPGRGSELGQRSGSQETILHPHDNKVIVKTTEVRISY